MEGREEPMDSLRSTCLRLPRRPSGVREALAVLEWGAPSVWETEVKEREVVGHQVEDSWEDQD